MSSAYTSWRAELRELASCCARDLPCARARLPRGRCGPLRLLRLRLPANLDLVVDLADRHVGERARPVHHLHRFQPCQPAARRAGAARRRLVGRLVARQAPLEADQPAEVRGQQDLRQIAAHEHDHRVVAEPLAVALRGLEGVRAAPDERVRRRARLQPQRQRAPDHGEDGDDRQHAARPAGRRAHDPLERGHLSLTCGYCVTSPPKS